MSRILAAAALVCASCQTTGMSFVRDDRVRIVAPAPRGTVRLPVTVRWTVSAALEREMRDGAGERYFAVFVDTAPIRGGKDISDLVSSECRRTPGCGDEEWFNERGIYFTSGTSVVVDELEDLRDDRRRQDRDRHRATVVVMRRADEPVLGTVHDGTRDGEGSASVEFWVLR